MRWTNGVRVIGRYDGWLLHFLHLYLDLELEVGLLVNVAS